MDRMTPSKTESRGQVPRERASDAPSVDEDDFVAQRDRRRDEVRAEMHGVAMKLALYGRKLADPALADLAELIARAVIWSREDPRGLRTMTGRARARANDLLLIERAIERPQTRCDAARQLATFVQSRSIAQFRRASADLREQAHKLAQLGHVERSTAELERADHLEDQAQRYEADPAKHYAADFLAKVSLNPILADAAPALAALVQHLPGSASQPCATFVRAWSDCVASVARTFENERFENINGLDAERIVTRGLAALGCKTKNLFGRR